VVDERSLPEAWRAIDELRDERREYLRRDVYDADERARNARVDARDARIKRLEDDDTSKSTGNRTWLLGVAQTVIGAALAFLAAYLTTLGH
jgi:hypothetical protein